MQRCIEVEGSYFEGMTVIFEIAGVPWEIIG